MKVEHHGPAYEIDAPPADEKAHTHAPVEDHVGATIVDTEYMRQRLDDLLLLRGNRRCKCIIQNGLGEPCSLGTRLADTSDFVEKRGRKRGPGPGHLGGTGPNARDAFSIRQNTAGDRFSLDMGALANATRSSGGDTHFLRNLGQLREVYDKIEAALRAQSLIVIRTDPGRSENDWRNIDVDVAGRGRDVKAPAGYYAPW